jgi:hypothetical protein
MSSEKRKCTKLHAQFIFDASTRAQLKRIACHKGCSATRRITAVRHGPEAVLRRGIAATTRVSAVTGNHNNWCTEMNDETTLQSIARSGPPEEFSLIGRARRRAHLPQAIPSVFPVYRVVMV